MLRFLRRRSDSRPLAGGTRADGVGAGFVNDTTGLGSDLDGETQTSFWGGCPLSHDEIRSLMRNFAPARRIATLPAETALQEGVFVKGSVNGAPINVRIGGKPDEKEEEPDPIARWTTAFGLFELVKQADAQALAHGSALWVYGVDDGLPTSEPLDLARVTKLLWVKVITGGKCGRVHVSRWGVDPLGPRFEQPTHYRVIFPRSGLQVEYHWTRVHQWIGVPVDEETRAHLTDYGGGSVFDLVWISLKAYGVSLQRMLAALGLLTQGVWTNEDLAHAIDRGDDSVVAGHYERMRLGGGQFGDYVLSAGESYGVVGRPLAGLPESVDRARDALVVDSGMGEAAMLGSQPALSGGLNSDQDAGWRGWFNKIASAWPRYAEPLAMFYAIASRALNGPTQGIPIVGLEVQQPSLWSLTPAEQATVRSTNATARAADISAGLVSVAEARTDKTIVDEYELAPEGVADLPGVEEDVPIDEIEVADDDTMPQGERPLSLAEARDIIGARSNAGVRGFIARSKVPLFRPGAQYRVFESHLRAAMRESQVV